MILLLLEVCCDRIGHFGFAWLGAMMKWVCLYHCVVCSMKKKKKKKIELKVDLSGTLCNADY